MRGVFEGISFGTGREGGADNLKRRNLSGYCICGRGGKPAVRDM